MKKLLIAYIMGALMTGAWAVQQANAFNATKNSFENADDFDSGALKVEGQWVCEDTDATLKQVAYVADTDPAPTYSGTTRSFDGDNLNYLSIDTGSDKPLWRTLASDGSAVAVADSETGGYVIDALVQFTGTDTAPTPQLDDRLVLWMETVEGDDGVKTSTLNVICGQLNDDSSSTPKNVTIPLDVEVTEGQWARISAKYMIYESEYDMAGFVVFVDGKAVSAKEGEYNIIVSGGTFYCNEGEAQSRYDNKQLFPSMIDNCNITKVGFEGSGKIDDFQILAEADAPEFTKYDASAVTTHTVSFVAKGSDGGTPAWSANDLTVNDGEAIPTASIPATDKVDGYTFAGWFSDETCETSFEIGTEVITGDKTIYAYFTKDVVSYTVTFAQKGLPDGTAWTAPDALSIESGKTIGDAIPTVPEVTGYTATGWFTDENCSVAFADGAITQATILYAKYTVVETDPDPIAPGATAEFTDETKANTWAANKDNIVIPPSLTTDAAKNTYKSYLVGTVTGNDADGYTVTFDIDSDKEAALETALEEVLPKVLDGTEITTAVPGFYYAVKACDTVGGEYAVKGDWTQAGDDGTVTLSVTKTEGKTAEFYKIVVQAVDPNAAK